ncbi:MAG: transglycosylase SLT domain-containing protein, partial [Bacteroidaceae bacterium]|nr:transglycosylase SLT domain-containing protein [Bacteroidaceae bacterium]
GFVFSQNTNQQSPDSLVDDSTFVPEGILVGKEDLLNDYLNKNNLTKGGEQKISSLSYNDSILVSRLSRIPAIIEMPLNNVTRKSIELYSGKMKESVAIMLGSINFYVPIFEEALEKYGLPLELKYLPVIESALRPTAVSKAGAAGLWQFIITTGKRYGLQVNSIVDERRDPIKSSDAAARYLSDLYDMFGDWSLAIAAYNCGEGNVKKALLRSEEQETKDFWSIYNYLPKETRGYVPAFIAANYIMTYYCNHGIVPHEARLPDYSDTVVVARDLNFKQVASVCNITIEELRALNPQYRRDIIPMNYSLRLPSQALESFVINEDSVYDARFADMKVRRAVTEDIVEKKVTSTNSPVYVKVRNGDSLSTIAKRNKTTVAKLRSLNGIKGNMIRAGQRLRVK